MKKSKTNRFFKIILCVIISFSFWTLNKLSKKTKNNISVKINVLDLPENLVLDSVSSEQVNFNYIHTTQVGAAVAFCGKLVISCGTTTDNKFNSKFEK